MSQPLIKRKVGRPRTLPPIDLDEIEKLGMLWCTHEEIASFLGCSVAYLEHNPEFVQAHKKGMDKGCMSLRRQQYKLAMDDGNVTMAIWLGKQKLGQKDKQEIDATFTKKSVQDFTDEELKILATGAQELTGIPQRLN